MIFNIVINQRASLPVLDKVAPETKKKKDSERQRKGENHTWNNQKTDF